MQIIDIKGKKWAVGLDWELLANETSTKQESKEVAEKTSSNHGILIDYDGVFGIGLVKKNPPKVPSASYHLALANQEYRSEVSTDENLLDWIVLEESGDDKYWMGVIKSGIPAPQFDAILDITSVKDKILELLVADTYKLYSTSGEISSLFEGLKEVENKGLNDLTANIKVKEKYLKLRGIPNSVVYAGIGFMVLAGLAWAGLSFMEGRSLQEKAANFKKQQEAEKVRKQQEYETALHKFEDESKKNKVEAYNNVINGLKGSPKQILNTWYNAVGNLNIGTHGWGLKTVECYYNVQQTVNRFACDYQYFREGLATNRMLLEDFPHARISGNEAVVTYNIELGEEYLEGLNIRNFNELKGATDWNFNMVSQLQLLKVANIDYRINPSTEVFYTLPSKPIPPETMGQPQAEQKVSLGVAQGTVLITGRQFELVKELADNVDFYGLSLRKIKFNIRELGEINWEATFNYYIRNQQGGIDSSESKGLTNNSVTPPTNDPLISGTVVNQGNLPSGK